MYMYLLHEIFPDHNLHALFVRNPNRQLECKEHSNTKDRCMIKPFIIL